MLNRIDVGLIVGSRSLGKELYRQFYLFALKRA